MKRLFKNLRRGERGFTLIELLVVIGILGIISAIVVPNFGNLVGQGQDETCQVEERIVTTAILAYSSDSGSCPADISDLSSYFEDSDNIQGSYTLGGVYPSCTVEQTYCPAEEEDEDPEPKKKPEPIEPIPLPWKLW